MADYGDRVKPPYLPASGVCLTLNRSKRRKMAVEPN